MRLSSFSISFYLNWYISFCSSLSTLLNSDSSKSKSAEASYSGTRGLRFILFFISSRSSVISFNLFWSLITYSPSSHTSTTFEPWRTLETLPNLIPYSLSQSRRSLLRWSSSSVRYFIIVSFCKLLEFSWFVMILYNSLIYWSNIENNC